jgi:hypothetical protein
VKSRDILVRRLVGQHERPEDLDPAAQRLDDVVVANAEVHHDIVRSAQLTRSVGQPMVQAMGLEPTTSCLQSRPSYVGLSVWASSHVLNPW